MHVFHLNPCGVVWCGVVWCGVVWCGVVWYGVVWCGIGHYELSNQQTYFPLSQSWLDTLCFSAQISPLRRSGKALVSIAGGPEIASRSSHTSDFTLLHLLSLLRRGEGLRGEEEIERICERTGERSSKRGRKREREGEREREKGARGGGIW